MATDEELLRYAQNHGRWCNNIVTALNTKWGDMSRAESRSDAFKAELSAAHDATIQTLVDNEPTLEGAIQQLADEAQAVADEEAARQQALSQVP